MRHAIRVAISVMVLATIGAACQYPPSPTEPPLIEGDSLTLQTAITEGALPQGWDVLSSLGWQAEDVQPGLTDRVNDPARSPGVALIALGQNDGANGFDATDAQQLATLAATTYPTTCTVWLLPHYAGTDTVKHQGIEDVRTWEASYAAAHGQATVDWRPIALAHPEYIDTDGTHLTPTGRLAYGQLIQQGVATCA
jgi:hypothetical protein